MDFIHSFSKILPAVGAQAHCDIPCGIYEPASAKIAAMTILRMVLQIGELHPPVGFPMKFDYAVMKSFANSMMRRIAVKEQHAELCKKELLILWTDFFKPEHLEKFPQLHDMFWKAAKLCSTNKQDVSEEHARELIVAVDDIAKIFYEAKGVGGRYEVYKALTEKLF
ncbi:MAG: superoxide dismutase, Ni [Candidatus Sungbacteria bacterium RIFCSPLOWO2_02_FULL_54_10]|uniref:Superoxide dismutase, Ni n=2 Tax=Candidatus Sungiibacteriota TaxID=1817917 RepID=A0A1G2L5Z0_9BACT|nr:MAG: superoxide dismutase, Ni [Candidatus Sungbacteria bacterium RIFCSPHIGHO2_01_FULL_54_26]OHA03269.1 MAG: superoxide dismutase, Ni [Candidatus Sungbacteria bacterium RIFCSPHIGHO2_02_FULL_53_17]OHA07087.1 MAG: superoxide dismutase, Ni [Candidatus Sungbacteria bacterium RIFCSPLOWO2_01_FULL_54_21]OHA12108.1 MAG: superoxide dismutase, Ni [Candidatus Sungbacteria bacterium RIFCSPLOWO2_02_FULL_54_10]